MLNRRLAERPGCTTGLAAFVAPISSHDSASLSNARPTYMRRALMPLSRLRIRRCRNPSSSPSRTSLVKPRRCGAYRQVSVMSSRVAPSVVMVKNQWSGDHLDFRASMLGQNTTGTIDVAEDHVRLEVQLPWLLSLLANKAKALVEKQGKLMLEKPGKPSTTRS